MKIIRWTRFKKDFKKIKNDKKLVWEFLKIINFLVEWIKLPEKYQDHQLKWKYSKYRECHLKPDLLLVYEIDNDELILYLFRLASHSELF